MFQEGEPPGKGSQRFQEETEIVSTPELLKAMEKNEKSILNRFYDFSKKKALFLHYNMSVYFLQKFYSVGFINVMIGWHYVEYTKIETKENKLDCVKLLMIGMAFLSYSYTTGSKVLDSKQIDFFILSEGMEGYIVSSLHINISVGQLRSIFKKVTGQDLNSSESPENRNP